MTLKIFDDAANEIFLSITNEGDLYDELSALARSDGLLACLDLSQMVARYARSYNRRWPGQITPGSELTASTCEMLREYYRSE
jgi:hypothetical protein